ncbi:Uncharacterized conserved small protein [Klebsiella pneumoniae]|uniref:Uncharacterized conserved small protein n=1 Tax=Klebsiella pneumoniae TaxID=573 RepID=A0A2X3D211_KLEPN|nr:Uncharacterized conserved small protein [Klebsiella pneumoniae]
MEFHENRAKTAIYRFRTAGAVYQKNGGFRSKRAEFCQQMSDEQLKDIGLRRDQIN